MDINGSRASVGEEDYSLITHEKCNPPRAKLCIVFIVSLVVGTLIILLVVLTTIPPPKSTPPDDKDYNCWYDLECPDITNPEQCADVAIIGAGLAGSYAAWRLRNSSKSVVIYDIADHTGGRFFSHATSDGSENITLDLGASFFIPELHPLFSDLVDELRLETIPLAPSPSSYRLRGLMLSEDNLRNGSAPYTLKPEELHKTPRDLLRNILEADVSLTNSESLHTVLLEKSSYEAYQYLTDTLNWYEQSGSGNANIFLEYVTKMASLAGNTTNRQTITGGMETVVQTLIDQTREANPRFLSRLESEVTSTQSQPSYHVIHTLGSQSSDDGLQTVGPEACARSVIFTLPPAQMSRITLEPETIQTTWRRNLDKLTPVSMMRVVVGYTAPHLPSVLLWTSVITDLPIQSADFLGSFCFETLTNTTTEDTWLYEWESENDTANYSVNSNTTVTECKSYFEISIYGHHLEYWTVLLQRDGLMPSEQYDHLHDVIDITDITSSTFAEHVARYLQELVGTSVNVSSPTLVNVKLWADERDTGAFFIWKPGVSWTENLQQYWYPLPDVSLYLVGSSYSPGFLQYWGEGALYSVDRLLEHLHW